MNHRRRLPRALGDPAARLWRNKCTADFAAETTGTFPDKQEPDKQGPADSISVPADSISVPAG
ncbi:MAG: hypothetical protein RIK87_10340 [Fuerstiella sp.]